MKAKAILIIFYFLFTNYFKSQMNYSIGLSLGLGANIYSNQNNSDKNHFSFKNGISNYVGVKILKNLDEENKLFVDITYSRKKIELEYNLNESEIPFDNKEIVGQKYSSLSLFLGYRRLINFNNLSTYVEASVGADYNDNSISSNKGNGETNNEIAEPIYFENYSNTNLGEKSYTISSNIGFGIILGYRNQFDIGILMNIPFQKIQSKESNFKYIWKYQNKEYIHNIDYIGKIYYPSLKFTYYFF